MKVILALNDKAGSKILDESMICVEVNAKNQGEIEQCLLDNFSDPNAAVGIFQDAKDVGNKEVKINCETGNVTVDDPSDETDMPVEMTVAEMLDENKLVYVFDLEEQWMQGDEEMSGRWAVCYKPEEDEDFIETEWLDEAIDSAEEGGDIVPIEDEETNLEEKAIRKGYQKVLAEEKEEKTDWALTPDGEWKTTKMGKIKKVLGDAYDLLYELEGCMPGGYKKSVKDGDSLCNELLDLADRIKAASADLKAKNKTKK